MKDICRNSIETKFLNCNLTHLSHCLTHQTTIPIVSQQHIAQFAVKPIYVSFSFNGNTTNNLPIYDHCAKSSVNAFAFGNHIQPPISIIFCIRIRQSV